MKRKHLCRAIALSALASTNSVALFAQQDTESWVIEEVVVTAQKRTQSLQDVPIALTAFSSDFIEQAGASNFKGLIDLTPGFSVAGGDDLAPAPYIRGIGSADPSIGSDPSIGIFVDGIYASRRGGAITDFMDVERIEFLKGPQGTLFGRNAIGGAISITTQKPTNDFNGAVTFEVGNYNSRVTKGIVNIPVIEDKLFIRASGVVRKRDGWLENRFNGDKYANQNRATGSLKVTWLPTDGLEVRLSNEWNRVDEISRTYKAIMAPTEHASSISEIDDRFVNTGGRHLYGNSDFDIPVIVPDSERSLRSHSLAVEWGLDEEHTFTSLTAYRYFDVHTSGSFAGGEVHTIGGFGDEINESVSQEFRINGSYDTLDWFVGASLISERSGIDETFVLSDLNILGPANLNSFGPLSGPTLSEIQRAKVRTDSWAVYGDASWRITEKLELTFGARYSSDEKKVNFNNPPQVNGSATLGTILGLVGSPLGGVDNLGFVFGGPDQFIGPREKDDKWTDFSPRAVLSYDLTDDVMAYASVTKGYKSGGFNASGPVNRNTSSSEIGFVSDAATDSFDPETVLSYELGLKSTFLDGRLVLNSTLYSYDYEDLQVFVINNNIAQIENAGEASATGVEMDMTFHVTPEWTLIANAAWTDASYDEFLSGDVDLSGTDQLFSPKWSGSLAVDYHTDIADKGELRAFVSLAHTGEHLVDSEIYQQGAYNIVNARLTFTTLDEQWQFSLFGNNLTDKAYVTTYANSGLLWGFAGVQRNDPRMFGASVSYNF